MTVEPMYLSAIHYELGEVHGLEAALGATIDTALLAKLKEGGFRNVAIAPEPAPRLALRALARSLAEGQVEPLEVDALVYATCSFWGDAEGELNRELVTRELLAPLRLTHVELHGVGSAESGNLASALRWADALIRGRGLRKVFVVTADRVPNRPGEYRAMPSGVTINSDAAAASLLTAEPTSGVQLEGISQYSSARILRHVKGEGFKKSLEIAAGLRSAVGSLFERLQRTSGDYRWLVANNYSIQTLRGFAEAIDFDANRLFVDNIPRFGHAFAADNLINLADLLRSSALTLGERVLALSTGPLTWGALSFRRC